MENGQTYTLDAFLKDKNSCLRSFIAEIKSESTFIRGLPTNDELSKIEGLTSVLRRVVAEGSLAKSDVTGPQEETALNECFQRGWVHTELDDNFQRIHILASPLHELQLSWTLFPEDHAPPFKTVYDFAVAAIKIFRPSRFTAPKRRAGPAFQPRPPEAQYQDEFYRAADKVTEGSVRLSPEFFSARGTQGGRYDLFVAAKGWSIKILRDGIQTADRAAHFGSDGAYGVWMRSGEEISDHIILDFGTEMPQKTHEGESPIPQ